jgi:hypothetical protein
MQAYNKKISTKFDKAITCETGCLFTEPILGGVDNLYKYNQHNSNKWKFFPKNCNDRLSVILRVLILEDTISSLNQIIEGKREDIFISEIVYTEKGRFNDACDKIDSFKLIPTHLLDIAKRIYRIRNKFVHDLECEDFNFLNKKYIEDCRLLLKSSKDYSNISEFQPFADKLTAEIFNQFVWICYMGINQYLFAVSLWKKDQSSKKVEYYKNVAARLNEEEEKIIMSSIPIVTYENGTRVERYPKGVVVVNGDYKIK